MWGHESHSRPKGVHFEMMFLNVLIEPFEMQNQVSNFGVDNVFFIGVKLNFRP